MIKKPIFKELNKIVLYALSIFFILSFAYLSISLYIQSNTNKDLKNEIINSEKRLVSIEDSIITNKINQLVSDVLYLSDELKINNVNGKDYSEVEKQWLAYASRKKIFEKIRFIDLYGNEIIKVNYDKRGAFIATLNDLQNIEDKDYFSEAISIGKNNIYISKISVDKDEGEDNNIFPSIILAVPYYDQDDCLKGLVVLNYLNIELINQVKNIGLTSHGGTFMLDEYGRWIINTIDKNKEWNFISEDCEKECFYGDFPEEWEVIRTNGTGQIITQNGVFNYVNLLDNYIFTYNSYQYTLEKGAFNWYIVSYIPLSSQYGQVFSNSLFLLVYEVLKKYHFVYFLILVVSCLLSLLLTVYEIERNKIKYFSEFDAMTGAYNRRAGLEKLNQLYKDISNNNCLISICFIDINGLKQVNDYLGHNTGDELILTVSSVIKNNIRDNDVLIRIGGDEFLILFEGIDNDAAENVWKRIVNEYNTINEVEGRRYIISVSHGIELLECDSKKLVNEIISQADEKMYAEKQIIKQTLKVIRD